MKKFITFLLIFALIVSSLAFGGGNLVLRVTPINYMQAVNENMPEPLNLSREFTGYYGNEDVPVWEKIFSFAESALNAASFAGKSIGWLLDASFCVFSNLPELIEVESWGDRHGDTDDPNYAGGR